MKKTKEELQKELEYLKNEREQVKNYKNGQQCEVYSRIVGYYRAITAYNPGMKQRFDDQKYYNVE